MAVLFIAVTFVGNVSRCKRLSCKYDY